MINTDRDLTILGETDYRQCRQHFGIRRADRLSHVYVVGASGTGKSTLLENLVSQDIATGEGVALLDPHGDLVERLVARMPAHRQRDLIYLDAPDPAQPWGFNPLADVPPDKRPLAASGLLDVFKKLWLDSWGPRLEHILRNALLALLDQPEATLAHVSELLTEDDFRRDVARRIGNRQVRFFWLKEYEGYPAKLRAEAIAPLQNKVGAFLANPLLHRILTRPERPLDFRRVMDEGKVFLVNLAKGKLGTDTAALLGSLLVASLGAAAFSRADQPQGVRRDFWIHLDEFHNVTTLSLATMLSELRKYGVGLTLAHQYVAQLDEAVQAAVFGNVGTMICFRVGAPDAEILAPYFAPVLREGDLTSLPNHRMYVRLMLDGAPTEPFSAQTLPPALVPIPRRPSSWPDATPICRRSRSSRHARRAKMDILDLGSAPSDEDCTQVGTEDYAERARRECRALINQFVRICGEPPPCVRFRVQGNPHDFGTYYSVVVEYDGNDPAAVTYAYRCDEESPDRWDEEALRELTAATRRGAA